MAAADKFMFINIREYLANGDNEDFGEPKLRQIISDFSCPKNSDVERFLKNSAVDFTKKQQSVTYLVFSRKDGRLAAYFTLALKPLSIRGEMVSNAAKKRLARISKLDEETDTYSMAAYLIAQIGKNCAGGREDISGKDLIELAWAAVEKAQYMLGGLVVFLETEDHEKLLSFYRDNRFSQFDTRQTGSNEDEPHELVQLMRLL